jgi:hypothetical protein
VQKRKTGRMQVQSAGRAVGEIQTDEAIFPDTFRKEKI